MRPPGAVDVFVSYGVSGPRGFGIKQAVVVMGRAPQTADEINSVREWLQSQEPEGLSVAIISWQALGGSGV